MYFLQLLVSIEHDVLHPGRWGIIFLPKGDFTVENLGGGNMGGMLFFRGVT